MNGPSGNGTAGANAYSRRVQTGDIITHITALVDNKGKPLAKPETTPTKGMPLNDAVKKILGPRNTPVKLTVEREGVDKPLEFTIRRNRIDHFSGNVQVAHDLFVDDAHAS